MLSCHRLVPAAAFICLALSAAPALAQEGNLQIGLSTPLISHTSASLEVESGGITYDGERSETSWGIREQVSLEVGYGLSEMLVLGVLLRAGGKSESSELETPLSPGPQELNELALLLAPKLDVMFAPGNAVRPFLGVAAGLTVSSTEDDEANADSSLTGFELQGRAGLRIFAARRFSFDTAIAAGWATSWGEIEPRDGGAADISGSGFNVSLLFGVSGWI